MKAIVHDEYGSADVVLALRDIDSPSVEDDEVLIRVHAASVNAYDRHHLMTGVGLEEGHARGEVVITV